MRPAVIALAALALASPLAAQHSTAHSYTFNIGFHIPIGRASRPAPLCDGSEMASVRSRRSVGKVLFFGGLGVVAISPTLVTSVSGYSSAVSLMSVGAIASAVGLYLHYNSNPSDQFWQNTMSQIKVGETRTEDVRQCLGPPSANTSTGSEETWTYAMAKTGFLGLGGSAKTVAITFRDSVVSKLNKTAVSY
jgi:outer membrane protein assembly factor BamE (lipoprotein component of BamABCDE complex)